MTLLVYHLLVSSWVSVCQQGFDWLVTHLHDLTISFSQPTHPNDPWQQQDSQLAYCSSRHMAA